MKLVADANVLLAAILGGQAKTVLQHAEIEQLITTEATFAEGQDYVVLLAQKKRFVARYPVVGHGCIACLNR